MPLSSLLQRFSEPQTLMMAKLGRELRSKGIDVTDLSLGEPDFNTPDYIKEAAVQAIHANYSHYTPVPGYLDVREAVCYKLKHENNLDYKPEQIVVSTGAKQCIANTVLALVEPGVEVIIPTPYWVTYSALVELAGGKVVYVSCPVESHFKITPEQLEAAITPATKLFMFSSPCNPSGAVYSKEELEALVKVFEKHPQVYIMSDEIYEHITYGAKAESIARFDSIKDRVIIVNGLSKAFAMTGWRLGFMASNTEIAKAAEKLQGQFTSATCSIAQRAAIAALTQSLQPTEEMVAEFKKRRSRILDIVKEIPRLVCTEPEGAFYIFPDISSYYGKKDAAGNAINNSGDMSMYLLNTAHVTTVSGEAFGEPACIRISFANSLENIEAGMGKIKKALAALK